MTPHAPRHPAEHGTLPGQSPDPQGPAELPVEPDLGPVPPLQHPEDPGQVQPPI
jgi:hypothetical protein